ARGAAAVQGGGGGENRPPRTPGREPKWGGRPPSGPREQEDDAERERREHEGEGQRVLDELHQGARPACDHAAEVAGRLGTEERPAGDRVAACAPAFGPADRLGPLRLEIRAGRAVEERGPPLAPAPREGGPRERLPGGSGIGRDRLHGGTNVERRGSRVVAADALVAGAAEVESLAEEVRV